MMFFICCLCLTVLAVVFIRSIVYLVMSKLLHTIDLLLPIEAKPIAVDGRPGQPKIPSFVPSSQRWLWIAVKQPHYLWLALKGIATYPSTPRLRQQQEPTDSELAGMVENSSASQGLILIEHDPIERWRYDGKFDRNLPCEQATYIATVSATFYRHHKTKLLAFECILVNDDSFTPEDGANWRLAKLHFCVVLTHRVMFVDHFRTHFPTDSAITVHYSLPVHHPLRMLLEPHCGLQLALNDAVLYSDWSPLKDCFLHPAPYTFDALLRTASKSFEEYRFQIRPSFARTFLYGQLCQDLYDCMRQFVEQTVRGIPRDTCLIQWADKLAELLPGFPSSRELLADDELLIDVLTMLIYEPAIAHNLEHESAVRFMRSIPNKVRMPAPSKRVPLYDFDLKDAWYPADKFVFHVFLCMFGDARLSVSEHSVLDYTYRFKSGAMQQAARNMQQKFKAVEKAYAKTPCDLPMKYWTPALAF
eukprot:TRINITY_DN14102_c0_g1_i1.p1 TRINITY_DN14102_c0_g1~~TRINITY_DN14102_c0_g1_i1.p1  ORF type:complete len:474 (-),score=56.07 TRINITY_DN14102_c0_g1_i1:103-1524(-)